MAPSLTALVVDYGGVLTNPMREITDRWLAADRIDPERFRGLMRTWFAEGAAGNIGHDLETGRLDPAEFERRLADLLAREDGNSLDPVGLLDRMFAGARAEEGMLNVVRRARQAGLKTALLSNSWAGDYGGYLPPAGPFDVAVISGAVGLRKPEPEIYRLTAARLGVPPDRCVFVDDLAVNVRGAVAAGMVGVHHLDTQTTVAELEALFGVSLR